MNRARLSRAAFWAICLIGVRAHLSRAQDTAVFRPTLAISGFLEVYYRAGDPLVRDGFRLRKADLKLSGDVSQTLKWRLSFDGGKALGLNTDDVRIGPTAAVTDVSVDQKSKLLQDAALTYVPNPQFNLDVGQQVIPLSLEGTIPLGKLETPERTLFTIERSRAVGLGDVRDLGVSANGLFRNVVEYHAGVFNEAGDSQGTTDQNDQKAYIGRVAIHPPFLPGFQVGSSGAYEGGVQLAQRRRFGTEMQYRTSIYTLRAETMRARDGDLRRFGWYGLGAVRPFEKVQFVARFDSWDRDLSGDSDIENAYERQVAVGGTYWFDGVTRFGLNIVHQTFPGASGVPDGTFLLTSFQASF